MPLQLALPTAEIEAFCQRHGIRKLALFGSVLRSDFRPDSDVDVLVEFEPGVRMNFFTFVDLQDQLSALLQRNVDLHTPASLSRHIRPNVLATAQTIYERTRQDALPGYAR
jgi:predicted nucleotidyltransferase